MEPYKLEEEWITPKLSDIKDAVASPVWHISDKHWRLILWPKGYEIKTHLAIFVMSPKLQEEHKVKFNVMTVGGKKKAKTTGEYVFSNVVSNRGFNDFIPLNELNDYLTENGNLHFKVTITFQPKNLPSGTNYRALTGYIGLQNQGCTCYMNSILQCLFNIPAFRRIVFNLPTTGYEDAKNIPLALQRLFILMQKAHIAPSTNGLTHSFGWDGLELFQQHDVEEFILILLDNIEEKMKNTDTSDAIPQLFRGKTLSYTKCIDIDYT